MGEVFLYGCCGENVSMIISVQVGGEEGWMDRASEWKYRGTSLIRNSNPPQDHHRALGLGLL